MYNIILQWIENEIFLLKTFIFIRVSQDKCFSIKSFYREENSLPQSVSSAPALNLPGGRSQLLHFVGHDADLLSSILPLVLVLYFIINLSLINDESSKSVVLFLFLVRPVVIFILLFIILLEIRKIDCNYLATTLPKNTLIIVPDKHFPKLLSWTIIGNYYFRQWIMSDSG